MNATIETLARRYAQAFIAVFPSKLSLDTVTKISQLLRDLKKRPHITFYLKVSCIEQKTRIDLLLKFLQTYGLKTPEIIKLIDILVEKKRLFLIASVFEQLVALYKEEHNILDFFIESSSKLSELEKKTLEKFLSHGTNKKSSCTYRVNQKLIAGIRAQSTKWLWENSVRQKLNALKRTYFV